MMQREPRIGDTIEHLPMSGTWEYYGRVTKVDGDFVECGFGGFMWRFGSVGLTAVFRVKEELVTMEDPFFN